MFNLFSNDEKNKDRIHELEKDLAVLTERLKHNQENFDLQVTTNAEKSEAKWDREAANWMLNKDQENLKNIQGCYVACKDKQNDTIDKLCDSLSKLAEKQPKTPDVQILPTVCATSPCIVKC